MGWIDLENPYEKKVICQKQITPLSWQIGLVVIWKNLSVFGQGSFK